MSDSIEELVRRFEEDVHAHYPRSIGLFPIPEYPELESRGMWSAALDAILTTLRYLAPATLLTLFWGHQSFFFTLLRHIDNAIRAIIFSSDEQKQAVLQWLEEVGSVRVESLDTVWRHGWIVCGVLDSVLPGACAGHPPTRLSLKHAQAIADHYLGVEPVFSRQELESNDSLSRHQEWKLATYLDRIREALTKVTPPVSKPTSQRTSPETTQLTFDYVAKGSGLSAAQVNYKMSFKIYPTAQQALDPGEVTILIRGPKDTYGMLVLPPILGKAQKIRQQMLGLDAKQNYTENALPLTQGATYLRSYGKNDMNKTYYIPKSVYDIDIEVSKREDHVKVWYTVSLEGKYEISITSRGLSIVGSPFTVTAAHNILGILEKDNFCLEDGEEIDIVDIKTDRKVVLRIVDFVTEKMLLRENGVMEKITEDEAKMLMSTEVETEISCVVTEVCDHVPRKYLKLKFNEVAHKIIKMNRVCKIFNDFMEEKYAKSLKKESVKCNRNNNDIPDIVNSTLGEANSNPFVLERKDKYIVPENISVSIRTEKAKSLYEDQISYNISELGKPENITPGSPDSLERIPEEEQTEDESISLDRSTPISTTNPFLGDFAVEELGTFVNTEYETNNSQNEEIRDSSIKIVVQNNSTPPSSPIVNPFIENVMFERPKTPVYKIITGDLKNRVDSPYLDPKHELLEEALTNEFVNPFFVHQFQSHQNSEQPPVTVADFIIGAPVTLPPVIRVPSPIPPDRGSLITKSENDTKPPTKEENSDRHENTSLQCSTPIPTKEEPVKSHSAATFSLHSLDSNTTDPLDNSNASTTSDNQYEPYRVDIQTNREYSPRKDTWDSAYVSIDDNNGSPDNNNNENTIVADTFIKQKFSTSDDPYRTKEDELHNMGPAERELWSNCVMLKDTSKSQEDVKPYRWEIMRPLFTPIIEESDRSISSGMKESSLKQNDIDSVTVAFAELNDVYEEYSEMGYLENSSLMDTDTNNITNTILKHTTEADDTDVESASETLSDVMRLATTKEGTISEVQPNVTESVSVSQSLQDNLIKSNSNYSKHADEIQFGDRTASNIVLEKKRYWDEKIRQIEEKSQETAKLQKKRRISSKQLKPDSLSKRKGKQMLKNFLTATKDEYKPIKSNIVNRPEYKPQDKNNEQDNVVEQDIKLVDTWKKYWDKKLETENEDQSSILSDYVHKVNSQIQKYNNEVQNQNTSSEKENKVLTRAVKPELPEEEVFKAFETSPKRFFGTSRKCILNKIDTFLGKPCSTTIVNPSEKLSEETPDSGLVSSRISLFHNMTNTEPLPASSRKCQFLYLSRKDSENILTSIEKPNEEIKDKNEIKVKENEVKANTEKKLETKTETVTLLQAKRARITQNVFKKTFDTNAVLDHNEPNKESTLKVTKDVNKPSHIEKYKKHTILRKTSLSKSEMDIFNKESEINDGLDKHRSCDELPKINVKNFISLYENVSKSSVEQKPIKGISRPSSVDLQSHWKPFSVNSGAEKKIDTPRHYTFQRSQSNTVMPTITSPTRINKQLSASPSVESVDIKTDTESLDMNTSKDKETTYVSLSDIELEIIECTDKSKESSPERTGIPLVDYKNRFNKAKRFFQSIEELRDLKEVKKPRKLNECEILLLNESTESLEKERPQKRLKKKKTKSHSMPSSELAKYWDQMQEQQNQETKLVKISEKFNVEDLFTDVTEGKLSRQGSLRGIPHKKAVLEAFRSMDNIIDNNMSPYNKNKAQSNDLPTENKGRDAQTYLSEYPYLPTTVPSKSHSRLDAKASGLITLKELLEKKVRRNSVPDLRLIEFSAEL